MEQETKEKFYKIAKERYQWGNKAGKHLARMLRKKKGLHFIGKIQTKQGKMVYETKEIGEVFKNYYSELYTEEMSGGQRSENTKSRKINEFLKQAKLPKITENLRESLEKPITEEEIARALADTAQGKSPGPDGFTIYYYKKFKDILIPKMCKYMNGLGRDFELSREALFATITVIPQ